MGKLERNYLRSLSFKEDIDPFERAEIIDKELKDSGMSIRALSKFLNNISDLNPARFVNHILNNPLV